jgi:hypothetical protein
MTIMVAGGMAIASPGFTPDAYAANANLFVSAENAQYGNYMSGPQVIEVVVIDSDLNDTDTGEGEPDVTVNGKILRMVQATDGNWYGYFADRAMAQIADSTVDPANAGVADGQETNLVTGEGMDFGVFCSNQIDLGDTGNILSVTVLDTVGVALPRAIGVTGEIATGSSTGAEINNACTHVDRTVAQTVGDANTNLVVRESKSINLVQPGTANFGGQIGLDNGHWPFIQLYTLNPTGNVIVAYNKGGGQQSVTLTFDTVQQLAGVSLDRAIYPRDGEAHIQITDLWLNIDPTDEDSWTFGTAGTIATVYQVFDENGASVGDTATNTDVDNGSLTTKLSALMCDGNCILLVSPDAQGKGEDVLTLQDNDDSNCLNHINWIFYLY